MCCFSRPIKHVSGTSIFARMLDGGRQALIYAMDFEADEDLAMVLPLPVAPGAGEAAVEFVSFADYGRFFADLAAAFPIIYDVPRSRGAALGLPKSQALKVHAVGEFEASFVPQLEDFGRLDPRFRLDDAVWRALPQYADYGFAVFKLRSTRGGGWWPFARAERRTVHPMAFTFPSRAPEALFFPTVHVHDGEVLQSAHFDHSLYAQRADGAPPAGPVTGEWSESAGVLGAVVDAARAGGLVDGGAVGWRAVIRGTRPNADVFA